MRNHIPPKHASTAKFRPSFERLEDRSLLAAIHQLLTDINVVTAGSEPAELVEAGGILYFTAEEGPFDRKLWRSDGTASSTYRLTNLDPEFSGGASPRHLAASGGRLYFAGYTEGAGWELWTSDGTPAGTTMVKDIWVGWAFDAAKPGRCGRHALFHRRGWRSRPRAVEKRWHGSRDRPRRRFEAGIAILLRPGADCAGRHVVFYRR